MPGDGLQDDGRDVHGDVVETVFLRMMGRMMAGMVMGML